MIYDLSRAVSTQLTSLGYPNPVVYAPERTERRGYKAAVLFSRPRTPELIEAPLQVETREPIRYTRWVTGEARILATSSKPGATVWEHECEADLVADAVLVAIEEQCLRNQHRVRFSGYQMMTGEEMFAGEGAYETPPGAAVLINFSVSHQIRRQDYRRNGPTLAEISAFESTIEVS